MKIKKIMINNYRLLKSFTLELENELSLIIGKNNCGKTSLLSLLEKFFGTKSNTNNFSYDDFNIDFQKDLKNIIEADSNLTMECQPIGISLKLFIEYNESDNLSNISKVMMDLDPENKVVVLAFQYILLDDELKKLGIDYKKFKEKQAVVLAEQSGDDTIESLQETGTKNTFYEYMKKNHKKYFNIVKKSVEYDITNKAVNDSNYIDLIKENISINKLVNFKTISAKRNISNNNNDKTLSTLSSRYYEKREDYEKGLDEIEKFKETLSKTDYQLDKIYEQMFSNVIEKVRQFGGIKEGDSVIKIISSLQHKELLKENTTVMYEHIENQSLPENYNGLGYLNLISMIFEVELIISDFRKESAENELPSDINLLFIEEPEAHTHPQMQYIFINNIKRILADASKGTDNKIPFNLQTLITTHSSHITAESDFNDIKYFYKKETNDVITKNLKDLEKEYTDNGEEQNFKFLKQYLTLHRSELFFADKAIFIEGDTERILLPAMMKKIDNDQEYKNSPPLLSQNISVIEVGAYSHIFERFIDFIGIKSLIITDLDSGEKIEKIQIKGNKEVKITTTEKCRVSGSNATSTTNFSLTFFFSGGIKNNEKDGIRKNELDYLKNLSFNQKKLQKNKKSNIWEQNENGHVSVIFQTAEENSQGVNYNGRSFEDSFFHLNRQFIIDNIGKFKSLKNTAYFKDSNFDAFDLSEKCINKKPSFAMEVLLNSKMDESKNDYYNWEIPEYIKEGLLWLKYN